MCNHKQEANKTDIHGKKHGQKIEFFCPCLIVRYKEELVEDVFLKRCSEACLSSRFACDSSSSFDTGHSSCSQIKTSRSG